MKEEQLFAPVKKLFEDLGYRVNAEVKNCDMTATKNDDLIIIELKTSLNIKLLSQGLERQKTGANVFVAIPKPKNYSQRSYRDTLNVIKKLELGLIFVTVTEKFEFAEIVCEPTPFSKTRTYKPKKMAIINEINNRFCDTNTGGVSKKKIVTAYTEQCVYIACLLELLETASPKQLRAMGSDAKKTTTMLNYNFHGWFTKISKGVYRLHDEWNIATEQYPELVTYYRKQALQAIEKTANNQ